LKKYEEAFGCYDKALELNANNSIRFNNKGCVLDRLKRYDEAILIKRLSWIQMIFVRLIIKQML